MTRWNAFAAEFRFTSFAFSLLISAFALTGCGQKKDDDPYRSETAKSRTWRSERFDFEVTIPSERWDDRANPNVLALFGSSDFSATVAEARQAQSDLEWQAALQFAKGMRIEKSTSNADEKSGPNPSGNEFWLYVADVQNGPKSYFLGVSITRIRGKAVVMMFEGRLQSSPDRATAQRSQAIQFLSSVK